MTKSTFKHRFGTLQNVDVRQSESGKPFARFQIKAPNFTAYAVAFSEDLIKVLAETPDGERIWAGGYINKSIVHSENGERTYLNLVAQKIKIGEAQAEVGGVEKEITPDDLTKLKGVGQKVAQKLIDLGFLTFAQLAETNEDERSVLDADIPAVRGGLSRYDVFGQAAAMAA
jgi:predicted flap endonuclease-1-like 5' DNA nuclease